MPDAFDLSQTANHRRQQHQCEARGDESPYGIARHQRPDIGHDIPFELAYRLVPAFDSDHRFAHATAMYGYSREVMESAVVAAQTIPAASSDDVCCLPNAMLGVSVMIP